MSKILSYISIARKAGLLITGEEKTGTAIKASQAKLAILASDSSANAKHRAEGFVHERNTPLITVPLTKSEISAATGRAGCSMAVFTDIGLAASFVSALAADDEEFLELANKLAEKNAKAAARKQEGKAHIKNKKFGKRRKSV